MPTARLRLTSCSSLLPLPLLFGVSHVFLSPLMNSTRLGPGREIAQSLHRGRAISFFKDNPRRHPRNRQHRSHAYSRAETHQGFNGLNCRVRLFRHSKTDLGPTFWFA